jgi:hypothetical protein
MGLSVGGVQESAIGDSQSAFSGQHNLPSHLAGRRGRSGKGEGNTKARAKDGYFFPAGLFAAEVELIAAGAAGLLCLDAAVAAFAAGLLVLSFLAIRLSLIVALRVRATR